MPIDGNRHSFRFLATRSLPKRMQQMRSAMQDPHLMDKYGAKGVGAKTVLRQLGLKRDFPGCYVLIAGKKPIYVGISRAVVQRLLQHVKGKTHFDASLAYKITCSKRPHKVHAKVAMQEPAFRKEFEETKEFLKSLRVAFVEIRNDVELCLFEVYCALELDTCEWNTFRTH